MDIAKLVNPRSIAILGASERPSIGRTLLVSLERLGFAGAVYPINPKYPRISAYTCYPSLDALPEAPDVVAICVGAEDILGHLRALAARGAGAATIYGGGFAERGEGGREIQRRISELCHETGIALCGPNCMGVLNPPARSTTYIYEVRDPKGLAGNVALVTQSGSIGNGMMSDARRFGFSLVASIGNEAVVDTAALIDYLVDDPATKVIATFTETVRNPERYVAALDRAADRGKPVVVLKVGRSERAGRAITSHTGGLAGQSRVFSAMLRAHRAIEVADMDELTEVLAVCQGKHWPRGRRVGVVTGSGGQAELILDVATANGIDLPPLSPDDRKTVAATIGSLTGDGNPLDCWGNGNWKVNTPLAITTLRESAGHDAVVLCQDNFDDQPMIATERLLDEAKLLAESAAQSAKPHYFMNMRPGVMNMIQVAFLAEHGIAQIGGARQGLGAIDKLGRFAAPLPPVRPERTVDFDRALLRGGRKTVNEHDAKRLLARFGVPVTREHLVHSWSQARAAADEIGYPVVLKIAADAVPHKSEHGLVITDIRNDAELDAKWQVLQERVAAHLEDVPIEGFLVQQQAAGGVEVFAGVSRDPDFGLVLAFGMGGVNIEVAKDFALRLLPLRAGDAAAMIAETRGAEVLKSSRGRPAGDIAGLIAALESLADFAVQAGEDLAEVDLNPIVVLPEGHGCVAVDALIVPRRRAAP
jgi:acyl-CoA synthetase (NDP forming)